MVGVELCHGRTDHLGLWIGAALLVPGLADLFAGPLGHNLVDGLRNFLADVAGLVAALLGGDRFALGANFFLLDAAIAFGNLLANVVVDHVALIKGQYFVDVSDRCSAVLVARFGALLVV